MEPTTNHSWDIPMRQSPAAILIMMLQTAVKLVKTFWLILLVYIIRKQKDEDSMGFIWMILAFGVITIITTIIKYLFYKFHISDDTLVIQSGWLKKKTLSLPLRNIQAVHLEQNVWQRFLKVATITLDGTGSEKQEVKIDALKIEKAEELKQRLLVQSSHETDINSIPVSKKPQLRLSFTDLMKLSLSANHLEAFFILFAVSINLINDIQKIFNIDGWEVMGDYAGRMQSEKAAAISLLIILIAIVSIIISIIRTSVKYFDFRLTDTDKGWKIYYGLITRQQLIIPYNKIQIFSWRANWLRRKMDFWMIHVQSVGHEEIRQKRRISIPVTLKEHAISLAARYQLTPVFDPADGSMIHPARWRRRTLFLAMPVTMILTIILYLVAGNPGFWGLILLPLITWHQFSWYRNFRWKAGEEGIQMYSGAWGRRYTLLRWNKIQQVVLKQSLFQKRNKLATLQFMTAGGSVELSYINYDTGRKLTDQILYSIESSNEGWL